MALSLAKKLGAKSNLTAFSLNPGIVFTNLGSHFDLVKEFSGCRKLRSPLIQLRLGLINFTVAVDREYGYSCGWQTTYEYFGPDEGVAQHVMAAFDPEIAGKY